MTQLVLVLLAVVWIVVLAPDVARLFRPRRRATSSVDQFRQQLDSLGRSAPAAAQISQEHKLRHSGGPQRRWTSPSTSMPATPAQAAIRRRDIGTLLVLCTLVALAGTLVTGSLWALAACGVLFVASAAFVMLVVRRRRAAPTAEVHYLPLRDPATASTVRMIRRQANE
ncbi:MAG: hypothetical protein F4117_09200 [Acidimicrobiales bacterium]|nr:hypothetical protein [Acidimicrobiaceae bacterium]MXV88507.1 hypothetical protein [Acidimicrobiales bacterium]MDE0676879.1 hypothetical protein [Acidimicrobiaceae bacterium]MXX44461.1 hypothetical protein [Acidimicrobiales bacterium]MXY01472.1 hypothetical protein [Acidimicrobiales bacterium]